MRKHYFITLLAGLFCLAIITSGCSGSNGPIAPGKDLVTVMVTIPNESTNLHVGDELVVLGSITPSYCVGNVKFFLISTASDDCKIELDGFLQLQSNNSEFRLSWGIPADQLEGTYLVEVEVFCHSTHVGSGSSPEFHIWDWEESEQPEVPKLAGFHISPAIQYGVMNSGELDFKAIAFNDDGTIAEDATFSVAENAHMGTTMVIGNQVFYTPNMDFVGTDQFSIRAVYGDEDDIATVTVVINPGGLSVSPDNDPTKLIIGGSEVFTAIPDTGVMASGYEWSFSEDFGETWGYFDSNNPAQWTDIPEVDFPGMPGIYFVRCLAFDASDSVIAGNVIQVNIDYSHAVDVIWEIPLETTLGLDFNFTFYLIDEYGNTIMTEESFKGYEECYDYEAFSYMCSNPLGPLPSFTFDETTGGYNGISQFGEDLMFAGCTAMYCVYSYVTGDTMYSPEVYINP